MAEKQQSTQHSEAVNGTFANTTIPKSVIGNEKLLFESQVSKLNSQRESTLRHLVVTDGAVYVFKEQKEKKDHSLKRSIAKEEVKEVVTHKTSDEVQRSHRFLIKVAKGYDFMFIVGNLTHQARRALSALYTVRDLEPDVDLFPLAHLKTTSG